MRLALTQDGSEPSDSVLAPANVCPNIEATYRLKRDEKLTPQFNTVYFLTDIAPVLENPSLYEEDARNHSETISSLTWVVATFINGRVPSSDKAITSPHAPATTPPAGTVVVVVGQTPQADKEQDYHDWYDQEHGAKLKFVPGWQCSRRYSLAKSYGPAETSNFYGVNFYDEENGLGGPQWQAGITDWTLRIRNQAARPNLRRVWKVVSTGQ